ncbi:MULTISPECIES: flagellar hook-basal body complex protein FliE [Rhizobium/Agrobacterium group]|uniref:Flagellar hook-basal body complex protein FliE n=2 Tax=Rhizobium/Agrobacterium group TaxID=227290 RepID=B9JRP5_ALLAM|nr:MULTISPECIES: flagellar hook-basal body complex protein FliE [Rhizobium/Agrobacterium group]ACM35521.1 flagellar hook-basal body complex protein [Allorhizobium ampelinum S4]MCF1449533.1 flagellar hook-basal body complex protein FliE [Allorhizobium ampelinum]MCF1496085.1 flagellar hook-basal body complex protein FliE [Allorhizobium ampelinum]MUO29544.1 flagellar hook-basal body complex protein FliE [Agrobacterium vitis]MUO44097.1 flagellar hook-basal body complex protein FliE [Agrobacterium 
MIDSISKIGSLVPSGMTEGTDATSTASLGGTHSLFSTQTGVAAQNATPGTATGMSFSDVVGGVMNDAMQNLKTAESNSLDGMLGKVSTREVVDSVMSAQKSLQTAIALRDKLVSAFLDITKMQI